MIRRVGPIAAFAAAACVTGGIWVVEEPPPPPEPRVPPRIEANGPPELVPTDRAGLLQARVGPIELYYYEPDGLWYRRDGRRWFQAFRWDGYWFPPARLPEVLGEPDD